MVEWDKHFEISSNSPSGLVWANDRLAGFNNMTVNARKGDIAGCLGNQGYWMVYAVDTKKNVGCHRVIYEMLHGPLQAGEQIDHLDGDRGNNLEGNLRKVSGTINARNQKIRRDNRTGKQGVSWNVSGTGYTSAYAHWNNLDGTKMSKYFSVTRLGVTVAFRLAVLARDAAIESLNLQGGGYSDRHGQVLE